MRLIRMALVGAVLLAGTTASVDAVTPASWEQWHHHAGVFDVVGPRSDGRLVAAVAGGLVLVDPATGAEEAFAPDYKTSVGPEAYLALSPGGGARRAACRFARDDVFALALTPPVGITRVAADGTVSRFTDIPNIDTLSGIAFDTIGKFGRRLLVAGRKGSAMVLVAIDCTGAVSVLTDHGPVVEGGMQVAPRAFGRLAGQLVAADEASGKVWAFDEGGASTLVVESGVPVGGDVGVESVGFIPAGFFANGGAAYLADRSSPGSPTIGTDSILRLTSDAIAGPDLRDGDLLVATESAARTIAVHCENTCQSFLLATGPDAAHPEGRLTVLTTGARRKQPAPAHRSSYFVVVLVGMAVLSVVAVAGTMSRRRSRGGSSREPAAGRAE